ncbi:MAG TPA: prolyl oligopeptidase family serine peptidase [Ktedonobacteraceae bacterium]|jgi:pimeloyl-ACP methyl ester carboxylesterase|nr:prolyl oligopeptidase family serine peptidase [Ktedonobacteraceae bacterium]
MKESYKPASPVQKSPQRRTLKIVLIVLLVLVFLAALLIGGVSFYFSNAILEAIHYTPTYTVAVIAIDTKTITLQRNSSTLAPGVFEIEWPAGEAIIGPILSSNASTVTRQFLQTTDPLTPGTKVYWNRRVYADKFMDSLGLKITSVQVPDPLGPMPAWYVAGKLNTWAILVHGRGVTREETLRAFQPLAHLGLPLLAISYRNDTSAPASPDHYDHFGDTEWQDLEAGVKYALAHGARHLVLYGWSQGGAVVEAFVHRSSYVSYVQALVLDSPLLDLRSTLAFQAQMLSVPGFIDPLAEEVATIRSGLNFDALDQLQLPQPAIPILLFHGESDTTTPIGVSDAFAKAHPAIVTYIRVPHTDHTEAWNTDPKAYDAELTTFLTQKLHLQS